MVILMFSIIKSTAKKTLLKNYKKLFIPILLYELFSVLNVAIFSFGLSAKPSSFIVALLIVLLLFSNIFVLPFLTFLCLKIVVSVDNGVSKDTAIKSFLTCNNFFKIALISLVPTAISLAYSFTEHFKTSFESSAVYYLLLFTLLFFRFYSQFKFLACGYHFVTSNLSVKETITNSFITMKFKFWNYVLYELSFILWTILLTVIIFVGILLFTSLKVSSEYTQLLVPSGFGFMFFYRPYKFLCDLFYVTGNTEG